MGEVKTAGEGGDADDRTSSPLYVYQDSALNAAANNVSIVLASLLPTASIFVLYFVRSVLWRLGAIMLISAVFTTILAVFTSARRVEIFAAAVALASVQVVFVGTSSQGN